MRAGAKERVFLVNRARMGRWGTSVAIPVLLASQAFVGTASAADTRILFIGETGGTNRVLEFTPVSAGNITKSDIYVKNQGKQNLTKSHLYIGIAPASALPAGVTVDRVYGADSGVCTWTDTTVDCNFDSLTARGDTSDRSITVILAVATAGTYTLDAAVKVAESVADVGSNKNFAIATDTLVATETTCDSAAKFVLPDEAAEINPGASCDNTQRSGLKAPASAAGTALFIDDSLTGGCSGKLKCFGFGVQAIVNGGADVDPYLTWEISYSADLMKGIGPDKVGFVHGATTIRPGTLCSSTVLTNCIVGWTLDSFGTTFTVRTPGNGVMKGFR
jgi:hypothetical protein